MGARVVSSRVGRLWSSAWTRLCSIDASIISGEECTVRVVFSLGVQSWYASVRDLIVDMVRASYSPSAQSYPDTPPRQSSYNRPPQSSGSYPSQASDPKIAKLLANLTSERKNLQGANAYIRALQASSKNEAVIKQAQNEVRNAQANIKFLEDELAKLQLGSGSPGSAASSGGAVPPSSPVKQGAYGQQAGSPSRPGMQHAFTGQPGPPPLQAHGRGPSNAQGVYGGYPPPGGAPAAAPHQRGYSSPNMHQQSPYQGERPLPAPPGAGVGVGAGQQVARRGDDQAVGAVVGQTTSGGKNYTQLGTSIVFTSHSRDLSNRVGQISCVTMLPSLGPKSRECSISSSSSFKLKSSTSEESKKWARCTVTKATSG